MYAVDLSLPKQNIEWNFSGKTALVAGGSSGIGQAAAIRLIEAGCRVIVAGLPGATFEEAQRLPAMSAAQFVACDLTDDAAVRHLFNGLTSLNYVIHSAGMIVRDKEFEMETFARVIDVNLTSAMRVATMAKPLLVRHGGAIVNVASMLSYFGGPRVPAYTASKGGIAQLTKSLAVAWAKDNVRVNAVAPGWIATPLTLDLQQNDEHSARIIGRVPMARWGTPDDVAGAILFLCSDAAKFITGAVLTVDGGYSAC